MKNPGEINLPLPPDLIPELAAIDRYCGDYYFWTREGKPETAAGNYRRTLRSLGDFCGVPGFTLIASGILSRYGSCRVAPRSTGWRERSAIASESWRNTMHLGFSARTSLIGISR
jgi:hypothetical protein